MIFIIIRKMLKFMKKMENQRMDTAHIPGSRQVIHKHTTIDN